LLAVLWRLRYKLSLRDVAEMFLERGFAFTHEAIRDWETRFAPLIAEQLRIKRRGQAGTSWYVDETYRHACTGSGVSCIERSTTLAIWLIRGSSEKRNMEAAKRFFKQAGARVGSVPDQVTTDGHTSYPRAICETMGSKVQHRTSKYLNNRLEQDHRGIKQRYYPMHGFGTVEAAARFCCDARRIAQRLPASPHRGRSGLSPGTTTGFSPAYSSPADFDTSSLIAKSSEW
jgi:transposase-like protein